MVEISSQNSKETQRIGLEIGRRLKSKEIIALIGELGAGKTTLTQGLAEGLEVPDYITSPTFALINEYPGKYPFYHIDLYRLGEPAEIKDLGIDEYFEKEGITVIEWAGRLGSLRLPKHLRIEIKILGESQRSIKISGEGEERFKNLC